MTKATVTAGDVSVTITGDIAGKLRQAAESLRDDAPAPTVVTRARHGLVTVSIDGTDYALADIGLRMLEPRELARAQGFPDSYVLEGTKAQQIARVGNSVCPQVAAAIVEANLGQEAQVA